MTRLENGKPSIIADCATERRSNLAAFRIAPELVHFLPGSLRGGGVDQACAHAATLKQAIEALGVPHTEIGTVVVNGVPATLSRTVREGDTIEVLPHAPGKAPFEAPLAFVADAHAGGLAHMLRMLGFDTVYDQALHDREIAERAAIERRVVLTRDRELLKRRDVLRGCYLTELKPEAQLKSLAKRYPIASHMRPFTLCLHCNLPLDPADAGAVDERVPERIRAKYQRFMYCPGCRRIYWEGSHWERMRSVLAQTLEIAPSHIG